MDMKMYVFKSYVLRNQNKFLSLKRNRNKFSGNRMVTAELAHETGASMCMAWLSV